MRYLLNFFFCSCQIHWLFICTTTSRNDTPDNKSAFIEAQYICHDGHNVDFNQMRTTKSNVFCRNGEWIGELPKCIRSTDTNSECQQAQICEHICHVDNAGREYCACYKGFRMKNDRCVGKNYFQIFNLVNWIWIDGDSKWDWV